MGRNHMLGGRAGIRRHARFLPEGDDMGNPIEDAKGKAKEAAGAVTDSDSLKREGAAQQDKSDAQEDAAKAQNRAEAAEAEERANQ